MSIMDKEVRDLYLYMLGLNGSESKLHTTYEEWSNDALPSIHDAKPAMWYKGNILEIDGMLNLIYKARKNGPQS